LAQPGGTHLGATHDLREFPQAQIGQDVQNEATRALADDGIERAYYGSIRRRLS
jgi:hypothetical protein